jgi:hypothetical protein
MATDVQQLLLKIDASTELARRELKKMEDGFDGFVRRSEQSVGAAEASFAQLNRAATLVKNTIAGFVASIGIQGIVSFGRAVLEAADNLDAAAEKAGIGVERYQTLKESLRSLEVEGEKVDAIFGRLTDTLGAVQGGTAGEGVVAVLDKMGITSRILNGEIDTTDELLDAIAGSAGKFNSQAEFTAAIIDIVGRKLGVDLANAIKDGGEALKAGEQSFKDAGGVVDAEYIKKLADANETVDRFVSNTRSKLLIWSAETIMAFERAGQAATDFLNASANPIGQAGGVKASGVLGFLNETAIPFDLADAPTLSPSAKATIRTVMGQNGNLRANGLPGFDAAPTTRRAVSGRVPAKAAAAGSAASRATPAGFSPAQLRAGLDRADAATPFGDLGAALVDLDRISASLDSIGAQAVDLSNVDVLDIEGLRVGVGLLEDASFSLTDAVFNASNLGDALVNTFSRAGASLLQSGILNLLSGGSEGTSFGSMFKGIGSLFSGKGFAAGGRPPVGKISKVGENGEEWFIPDVAGTIIPNHALRAASAAIGGGGARAGNTTVQNFDLRGAMVTEDVLARIDARAAQAAQAGAMAGRTLAAEDRARQARRRL